MKTLYVGLVSIEREYESGISAELKSFFSNDIDEIRAWIKTYEDKFAKADKFSFDYLAKVTTEILVNSKERNKIFRPYYDYLALPLELRKKPGSEAKNEIERLRHDVSWEW